MCLFIAMLMAIVFYALLGKIDFWVLAERLDGKDIIIAEQWELIFELWPLWVFAFLAGVLVVLLALKLISTKQHSIDK